ncbi:MAG: hypothetical protein ABSE59_09610 [Opitutaceae bacterium]
MGDVGSAVEVFVAELALGLKLAKFGGSFVQEPVRQGTRAVDGELDSGHGLVLHRVRERAGAVGCCCGKTFFDLATAAETPHGATDFIDEVVFEQAGGDEVVLQRVVEFGVEGLFTWTDEVVYGEQAAGDVVLGGGGLVLGAW